MLHLKQDNSYHHKQLWGLFAYKPRWGLTILGWMVILGLSLSSFWGLISNIYPFLAFSKPVAGEVLIVEGWIGDEALKSAIAEYNTRNYQLLITTGVPLYRGQFLSEYKNYAQLAAATITKIGFDPQKIVIVPTPQVETNRTFSSAIAVKEWLAKNNLKVTGIDVYSSGVHSRRSWLSYKKVFEPEVSVGIIAYRSDEYNPDVWWQSSEGFKRILTETIGYIYIKFFNA